MVDQIKFERENFARLEQLDREITARVAAVGCPPCGGALHRSDFARKPSGALIAPEGEGDVCVTRFSLCCAREGCRKRVTPPSLRFLGRRVYLGVVVIVASIVAGAIMRAAEIKRITGVPARTARRWLAWWRVPFTATEVFIAIRARLIGASVDELPASIVARLPGSPTEQVLAMLALLAPLTTGSVRDGARFVRVAP